MPSGCAQIIYFSISCLLFSMFVIVDDVVYRRRVYLDGCWHGEVKASATGNRNGFQYYLDGIQPGQAYDISVKVDSVKRHADTWALLSQAAVHIRTQQSRSVFVATEWNSLNVEKKTARKYSVAIHRILLYRVMT